MSLKAPIPKPHTKTCKVCKTKFEVSTYLPFAVVCSVECSLEYAKQQQAKKAKEVKKEATKAKVSLKQTDIKYWQNLAQKHCNAYIRKRDGNKCISCSKVALKPHAGHYRPMGNNPAIRYHEDNLHTQCYSCNVAKSGNLTAYREALISKIGLEKVEWLESQKQSYKWTIEELKNIIKTYKDKIKDMK